MYQHIKEEIELMRIEMNFNEEESTYFLNKNIFLVNKLMF